MAGCGVDVRVVFADQVAEGVTVSVKILNGDGELAEISLLRRQVLSLLQRAVLLGSARGHWL